MTTTRSASSAIRPRSCVIRTIAACVSRCAAFSTSTICAWIVTSSAVVGSSAIEDARIVGDRHRDHRALAHAARELVRDTGRRAARRRGRPTSSSSSIVRFRAASSFVPALCTGDRLGDLVADREHRVQRASSGPGRSSPSARRGSRAEPARGSFSRSSPLKIASPLTIRPGGMRDQPEHRQHRDALPGPGFADDAEHLSADAGRS